MTPFEVTLSNGKKYEAFITLADSSECEVCVTFCGFSIELYCAWDLQKLAMFDNAIRSEYDQVDFNVTQNPADFKWVHIWGVLRLIQNGRGCALYSANVDAFDTSDYEGSDDEKTAFVEMVTSWLADPDFIELLTAIGNKMVRVKRNLFNKLPIDN